MNRNQLKTYAPKARRDFIRAMTDRAAVYGLTKDKIEPVIDQGDVAIIAGKSYPAALAAKRQLLAERVKKEGFDHVMEAMAYTWFNRLVAIRFMELHGYLDHGYRVLSAATDETRMKHGQENGTSKPCSSRVSSVATIPEILVHAEHVDLPGLDKNKVIALKLDGTKEADLYRMLLIAQCNALHSAMPFLFERIDDETELLLPDNLLHSDSLIRQLVNEIDEADWQEVEIIGWLYESYIAERYEAVIGRVVASDDIPAATQRFTPKWVVRYLVQNTLGRLWLSTYPESPLKGEMRYYIEPAEQTPEVQEQLRAITPTSLNPEEITFLDPACGSGHILVEAYDLFKAIYQERGYRAKDIPRLIVDKNLFGLEIDDRAAQLAALALVMKARADDRRIFQSGIQPHVQALIQTDGMDAGDIAAALNVPTEQEPPPPAGQLFETDDNLFTRAATAATAAEKVSQADVAGVVTLFKDAKTLGSLIQVPPAQAAHLPKLEQRTKEVAAQTHSIFSQIAARFLPVVEQAKILAANYDCVVANPPYMGGKYFTGLLKAFVADHYKEGKADLYACFIQRDCVFAKPNGFVGMITIPNWMFLSTFVEVRKRILDRHIIDTFIHNGRGVFGSDFGSCSFVVRNTSLPAFRAVFRRLFDKQGSVAGNEELERRFFDTRDYLASPHDFQSIPGVVIAYWISPKERQAFADSVRLGEVAEPRQGLATADDDRFLRLWHEVSLTSVGFSEASREGAAKSNRKWFPFNKGGPLRKWYGNNDYLVNWHNDGYEIRHFFGGSRTLRSRPQNLEYYFLPGITWSLISISRPSFRAFPSGFVIGHKGPGIFSSHSTLPPVLAFLNSCVVTNFLQVLSPAVGFEIGQIKDLPYRDPGPDASALANALVELHSQDWDSSENSWVFQRHCLLLCDPVSTVEMSFDRWATRGRSSIAQAKGLEERNNHLFIEAYGLQDVLSPEVPDDQITLYRPDREEDIKRLVSYAVGCMMGRYSLDKPGLIYAHSGNIGFDPSQYQTFPADSDGIIPLMETDWFPDDAANRFFEFIAAAWPGNKETTDETRIKHGQETNTSNPCFIRG